MKLRKDLQAGYYSIPISIYVDCEEEPDTDGTGQKSILNIYVAESTGSSESDEENNTVTLFWAKASLLLMVPIRTL